MNQTTQRDQPAIREKLRRGLLLFAGLYLLICTGCAAFQRRLIYFPTVFTREQVDQMAQEAGLERWTNSAGQFIGLKRPSPKQPANGSSWSRMAMAVRRLVPAITQMKFRQWPPSTFSSWNIPVTRTAPVHPAKRVCSTPADEAFHRLPTNQPIYLVGESLGSGVASYLAGTYSDKIAGRHSNLAFQQFDRCGTEPFSRAAGSIVPGGPFSFGKISPKLSGQTGCNGGRQRHGRSEKIRSSSLLRLCRSQKTLGISRRRTLPNHGATIAILEGSRRILAK